MSEISLKVEFGGGLELLFSNQKSHQLSLPTRVASDDSTSPFGKEQETKALDITYLIHWLRDHRLKERVELFMENDTVRPGILVLVNDTDWELEGEGQYEIKDGDEIVFISTLHGG
ncbi:ubiquitin-like modifier 1 [Neolentinus lepideus HHB14362 ss-1]|uniref:Ubiquitin-related modifier 1 n=1 Tax=Neolentinus lepideus HHB14362 ss-1 TaxID=1314782 RepID=A0A165UIG9_9AGAM|nr:ubiquitin-like modifier 1 [Neolentinus lepideus HHB14362 ss-1]